MSGLFLLTIGIVIAAAFFYPFFSRRGRSVWELSSQSPHAFKVLITGGCCGLILVVIGVVMANWHRQSVPTYRTHRPSDDAPEDNA